MYPNRQDPELHPIAHPGADSVLRAAEAMRRRAESGSYPSWAGSLSLVAAMLAREAHLCSARYLELLQSGLSPDACAMLAEDDMGWQLANGVAESVVTEGT